MKHNCKIYRRLWWGSIVATSSFLNNLVWRWILHSLCTLKWSKNTFRKVFSRPWVALVVLWFRRQLEALWPKIHKQDTEKEGSYNTQLSQMNTPRVQPIFVVVGFLKSPCQLKLRQNVQKSISWLVYQVVMDPLYYMQFPIEFLGPSIFDSNHINALKLEHVCVT